MERIPKGAYNKEFREEAVKPAIITEGGLSVSEVGSRLSLPKSTMANWIRAYKAGRLGETGISKLQRPLTEVEQELMRVKRELAVVKMERDILKKAAAYFAKESLPGTR